MKNSTRTPVILSVLFLAAVLITCSKVSTDSDDGKIYTSTLKGNVIDKNGDGLNGVSVTSEPAGYSTTSNSNGSFSIPDVEAGTYILDYYLQDYIFAKSDTFTVGLADFVQLDDLEMLYAFGIITGTVYDKNKAPLFDASVEVKTASENVNTKTDINGTYTLKKVRHGSILLYSGVRDFGCDLLELTLEPEQSLDNADVHLSTDSCATITGLLKSKTALQKRTADSSAVFAGVEVTALNGSLIDTTDEQGHFELSDFPPGVPIDITFHAQNKDSVILEVIQAAPNEVKDIGTIVIEELRAAMLAKTFLDQRDSTVYKKVTIGTQIWIAENLNFNPSSGNSWCFDENESNCDTYGRLYDWTTAVADQHGNGVDICPIGWHLPSDVEWKTLEMAIGMSQSEADKTSYRGTVEGTKLKSAEMGGTDDYGFAVVGGGYRKPDGSFNFLGWDADFWTATEYNASSAWDRWFGEGSNDVSRYTAGNDNGYSVRCLQDSQ